MMDLQPTSAANTKGHNGPGLLSKPEKTCTTREKWKKVRISRLLMHISVYINIMISCWRLVIDIQSLSGIFTLGQAS